MSKRKKSSRLGLVIVLVALIFFGYVMVDQQHMFYMKEVERARVEKKMTQEKKQNEELNRQKDMLDSDEYIEKVAREKLGMVKKGEKVFVDINK